ncbi:hypothetical protein KL953_22055 [Mycolicibacterium goodii]|uniref:TPR repeat region-containing protein n=1 Tax=Mycolicibacterium goodii TaxID=134601 RepID=UPI001BDCC1B7|nr:EspA/EspE family type VII secretion system effector [Mycolicibacterium goodii]MBU8811571.1 hypothetical protein [Mycolicibacterium goodii]
MGALDGFYSTWNKARETFGQGVPTDGSQFDQSRSLTQMKASVEAAAPDDRWQGSGANAYAAANKEHAQVYQKLADLDQKMAAEVKNAANVVSAGRTNLDNAKGWVESMANSLPATSAQDRERKLIPIAREGINRVDNIVKTATSGMMAIKGNVEKLRGEYDTIKTSMRFGPESEKKPGDKDAEALGAKDEHDEDLKPEDMEDLVRRAVKEGDQDAAATVDELLNGIDETQLGPNSKAHPLTPVQAELVGQLQAQLKPMSLDELNVVRERLGPHKDVVANAMQVMSDPDVSYPRHDGDGPQIVSDYPGAPLPNRGVLPGDTGALPDGVQAVLNQRGDFLGPPDPGAGYPGSRPDLEGSARHEAETGLRNLADIVGEGDPKFQQGSQLDREMMSNAKEWLGAQEDPGGRSQSHWGDEVVQRVFETAGRDTVVSHDMIVGDREFVRDVLTHEWQDDGKAARTLTDWIGQSATSTDPIVNARAGETASALADFLGDPANKDLLLNNNTGSHPNMSLGQMNPELTRSLAGAVSPYIDDMAGRSLDGTTGWTLKDGASDLSYPHAANVLGVLGTDADAAKILDDRSNSVQATYINEYANSVIDSNGQFADAHAMEAAGRLKGIVDQGAFIAASDVESDAAKARQAAWERMERNYNAAAGLIGSAPYAGPGLELGSTLMKDAILGPRPDAVEPGHAPIESSIGMKAALASAFSMNGIGDPVDIDRLMQYDEDNDKQFDVPPEKSNDWRRPRFESALSNYFSNLNDVISDPLDAYDRAYRDVIR